MPQTWDEYTDLDSEGGITAEIFDNFVRTHFLSGDGHSDDCEICEDDDWFDFLFDDANVTLYSVELMEDVLGKFDYSFSQLRFASEIPNAPLEWMERLLPEYWPDYWDLLLASDDSVQWKLEHWNQSSNCTPEFLREYILNVHETRRQAPDLTSQDGDSDDVVYEANITCFDSEEVDSCQSCQALVAKLGLTS